MSLARGDLDDAVEVAFGVAPPFLDFALDHLVVAGIDVVVERGGDLLDLERREEAVVDPVLQGVDVNRLAEIGVGIGIGLALRRRRQPELHGGREVVQDGAPVALVIRAAAMAFVDDDEVEEVGRVVAEARRGLAGRIAVRS